MDGPARRSHDVRVPFDERDRRRAGLGGDRRRRRREPADRLRDRDRGPERRPLGTRRGRCRRAAARARLAHGRRDGERTDDRARRTPERPDAGRLPEEDVLRQLRSRGGRERGEGRSLRHGPPGDRLLRPCLPRTHVHGDDAHREGHAVQAGLRAVLAGGLPLADGVSVPVARWSGALRGRGARVRARRDAQAHRRAEHRRRVDRADPGRRRVHRPGARLPQGIGRLLRRARHRVHRRRDPERYGARGSLVCDRRRAGCRARHRPHGEVARRGSAHLCRDRARDHDGRGPPRRFGRDVRREPGRGSGLARGARQDRARGIARTIARARRHHHGAFPRVRRPLPRRRRRPRARRHVRDRARRPTARRRSRWAPMR